MYIATNKRYEPTMKIMNICNGKNILEIFILSIGILWKLKIKLIC